MPFVIVTMVVDFHYSFEMRALVLYPVLTVTLFVFRYLYSRQTSKLLSHLADIKLAKHVPRVGESMWFFTYYVSMFTFATCLVWGEPWFLDRMHMWDTFPSLIPMPITVYLCLQLAYYSSGVAWLFIETRKSHSDFWLMFVHHIACHVLLVFSLYFKYDKFALVSVWLHDMADMFLEGSKVLHYCRFHRAKIVSFGVLVPLWFIPRCIIFPYKIIWVSVYAPHPDPAPYLGFMRYFLVALWILDSAWFYMIARLAVLAVVGKKSSDIRSDDDEGDPTSQKYKEAAAKEH